MIVSLYASILAIVFLALSYFVVLSRRSEKVALGTGDSMIVQQRMRAQANFSEYTPLTLILMFFAEYQGLEGLYLHILGCMFLLGRLLHAYSLVFYEKYEGFSLLTNTNYRRYGMYVTLWIMLMLIIFNLWQYLLGGI